MNLPPGTVQKHGGSRSTSMTGRKRASSGAASNTLNDFGPK
jgi:hypothetical protein